MRTHLSALVIGAARSGVIKIHYSVSSRKAGTRLAIWRGSSNVMKLSAVDIAIILGYFLTVILIGLWWVSRRGAKDLDSCFLGSKSLPWFHAI
jgi:hypothetical protein